jgi:hypothetical protein
LPSDDEVVAMIESAKKAQEGKQPSPQDQKDMSQAGLNKSKHNRSSLNWKALTLKPNWTWRHCYRENPKYIVDTK